MSDRKSSQRCQEVNKNPRNIQPQDLAQSAVNAVAIARDLTWREAYECLIAQAHKLSCMPGDEECVEAMLKEQGFFLQPGISGGMTVEDLCRTMDEKCRNGQAALAKLSNYGNKSRMIAIVPGESEIYSAKGTEFHRGCQVTAVWIRWTDGMDHSPVPRRKGISKKKIKESSLPVEHRCFQYYQPNPENRFLGDCVIRGISAVCGMDWHKTVDCLAKSGEYAYIAINNRDVYSVFLKRKGFVRHDRIKRNGRMLTGSEFCDEMTVTYRSGERIFSAGN